MFLAIARAVIQYISAKYPKLTTVKVKIFVVRLLTTSMDAKLIWLFVTVPLTVSKEYDFLVLC